MYKMLSEIMCIAFTLIEPIYIQVETGPRSRTTERIIFIPFVQNISTRCMVHFSSNVNISHACVGTER
jgi:hypothetical protein